MKVLVIGGSGFLGSAIVKRLMIVGYDVASYSRNKGLLVEGVDHWIKGDILDQIALKKALLGVDLVIHSADSVKGSSSVINNGVPDMQNIEGMINLLSVMRESSVKRLIFLSSGGTVYGNNNDFLVDEFSALEPISFYGIQKVAVEHLLRIARIGWGLEYMVIRPSNPYGEGQDGIGAQGLIGVIIRNFLQNKRTTIFGNGEIVRDYIYISDFIDFVVRSLHFNDYCIYNCGSGTGSSVNEVISQVEEAVGAKILLQYKPSRPHDVQRIVLNCNRAKVNLDWHPRTSLNEGIKKHYKWLKDNI